MGIWVSGAPLGRGGGLLKAVCLVRDVSLGGGGVRAREVARPALGIPEQLISLSADTVWQDKL